METVARVLAKLRELASSLSSSLQLREEVWWLLHRGWRIADSGACADLEGAEIDLGEVVAPSPLDYRAALHPSLPAQLKRERLTIKFEEGDVLLRVGGRVDVVIFDGFIMLEGVLRLAVLERLNPGLLDRIVGAVGGRCAEAFEALRVAISLLDAALSS